MGINSYAKNSIVHSEQQHVATSLDELLSHQGQDFIDCAYKTLLGRMPDETGCSHYMNRLKQGYSKLMIVMEMRSSPESQAHELHLPDLDAAISRYKRRKWPVLGVLFKWIDRNDDDRSDLQSLRKISMELASLREENKLWMQKIENKLIHLHELTVEKDSASPSHQDNSLSKKSLLPESDRLLILPASARKIYWHLKASIQQKKQR